MDFFPSSSAGLSPALPTQAFTAAEFLKWDLVLFSYITTIEISLSPSGCSSAKGTSVPLLGGVLIAIFEHWRWASPLLRV